jgi:hypothetical protein
MALSFSASKSPQPIDYARATAYSPNTVLCPLEDREIGPDCAMRVHFEPPLLTSSAAVS